MNTSPMIPFVGFGCGLICGCAIGDPTPMDVFNLALYSILVWLCIELADRYGKGEL